MNAPNDQKPSFRGLAPEHPSWRYYHIHILYLRVFHVVLRAFAHIWCECSHTRAFSGMRCECTYMFTYVRISAHAMRMFAYACISAHTMRILAYARLSAHAMRMRAFARLSAHVMRYDAHAMRCDAIACIKGELLRVRYCTTRFSIWRIYWLITNTHYSRRNAPIVTQQVLWLTKFI